MPERPADLPDFDRPPVTEVILGVQLDPLPLLRAAHLGLLWSNFRDDYPFFQEHPPIDTPEENFDADGGGQVFQFQVFSAPPVPRLWFVSKDGTRLLQVQQDRFLHNWRRLSPEAEYPRYESLRESFVQHYRQFANFVQSNDLGIPAIRHAEVTYVNPLGRGVGWNHQSELHKVIRMWRPDFGDEGLLVHELEDVRLTQRHLIRDDQGPYARLYVSVEPVIGGNLVLNLNVRGRTRGSELNDAVSFFNMGRSTIVRAFTAVSTDAMHRVWRRTK